MGKEQVGNRKVFSAFLSVVALSSEIKPRAEHFMFQVSVQVLHKGNI